MANRFLTWARARMPTRESLMRNRWIAPLAKRPELWVFSRRTVPRAVAIGLFIGIFLMIPGLQVLGAVLLCVPFRANIPVAAAATFVSLPPTVLFVFLRWGPRSAIGLAIMPMSMRSPCCFSAARRGRNGWPGSVAMPLPRWDWG